MRDLLDAAPDGLVSACALERAGFTRRQIRALVASGALSRVRRDAYGYPVAGDVAGSVETRYRRTVLAALAASPGLVLTGPAALVLLDLPLLRVPATVHVATARRGGPASRSRLTPVAPNPAAQDARLRGTVGPAAAILDTARLFSLPVAVAAADAALRAGLTDIDELARVLAGLGRAKGIGQARTCVALADHRSESPGESWSSVAFHLGGLPRPERQVDMCDTRGFIGRVDFWWPEARVAGEFDGRVKYGRTNPAGRPPEQVLWDEKRREDRIRATGARVVRWSTADLHRPAALLATLRAALH